MISIVIPCYNEGKKLIKNTAEIKKYMEQLNTEYEIICVNDGSSDDTGKILKQLSSIKAVGYEKNMGKGFAVKTGIKNACGEKIIFMDADLSTDLCAIKAALEKNADIVIGSRTMNTSDVNGKSFMRNLSSFISNLIIRVLTGLKFRDTQCGFKLLSKNAAELIISKQKVNRWAFDVEYLYIAKLYNIKTEEIPVIWNNDDDSRVNLIKDSIPFFKEILNIRKNKKYYLSD